jgi:5-methylcytosine-specific restriction endonuclease McrA
VEGFPVDMALMRSLRASLDEFRGYEIVHMPARFSQGRGPLSVYPEHGEHGQLDQEDELENKRLDNERKEYQDRSLANMRAATASDEKSAQTARPDSSAHQSKRAEVDEQTPVEGSAKVSTKSPKEPTAAAAASRPVQDGDDPLEKARNGKLLLQCLSCGETFAELIDVDSHVPHKDMPLVVIRLIAVHSGQLFQCGPPFTLASDKSKTEALVRASQAPEAAPRTQEAAMSARHVEEISEQMNRLCQETGRLAVELVQHLYKIQAAHEQRQQEAMQQEIEALNVQEASIAVRKRELRAKMRK